MEERPRDLYGNVLNVNDTVEILISQRHKWLQKGNTLKVGKWERRQLYVGDNKKHVVLFLKTNNNRYAGHVIRSDHVLLRRE